MDEASSRFAACRFLLGVQRTLNTKKHNNLNRSLTCDSTYIRSPLIS